MFFGVLIITVVYVPILALEGIEGKMFKPMAVVVMLALGGSLVLALTLMPVLCSYLLGGKIQEKDSRIVSWMKRVYLPLLNFGVRHRWLVVVPMLALFAFSLVIFTRLGAEFIPQLDEGDFSSNSSAAAARHFLPHSDCSSKARKCCGRTFRNSRNLLADWHRGSRHRPDGAEHRRHVCHAQATRGGARSTARPLPRPISEPSCATRFSPTCPGQNILVTQPIQLRFNEIMAGARADLMCKIYGDNSEELERLAGKVRNVVAQIPGGNETEFDSVGRVPMIEIELDREAAC